MDLYLELTTPNSVLLLKTSSRCFGISILFQFNCLVSSLAYTFDVKLIGQRFQLNVKLMFTLKLHV